MVIEEKSWNSRSLKREMTVRVIGEDGTPVLVLPDKTGDHQNIEKFGMTDSISFQLENGYNQLFCIDTPDVETFFDPEFTWEEQVSVYKRLEAYIIDEVIPFVVKHSGDDFIILAGVELGAFISMNLVLKYPFEFGKIITIGGLFDLDTVKYPTDETLMYFKKPTDYLANMTDRRYLDAIQKLDIRIAVNSNDPVFDQNLRFSETMNKKGIPHVFDIWDDHPVSKWSGYCEMFMKHIV